MLPCGVALCERLHGGGDLRAGGDCRPRCVLVRRGRRGRVRLLSGVRELVRGEVDDAVGARAVQAAEDVQALVLAPVEVQAEDGGEDEQHHGEVEHDHNGRLGRGRKTM